MFILRNAEASDIRFIVNSWSNTNVDNYFKYNGGNRYPRPRKEVIMSEAFAITCLLQQPNYIVKVACDPEDNNHIYGYIAYEFDFCPQFSDIKGFAVDFIYTKLTFRRFGIGKALFADITGRVYVGNPSPNWANYLIRDGNVNIQYAPEISYRGLDS